MNGADEQAHYFLHRKPRRNIIQAEVRMLSKTARRANGVFLIRITQWHCFGAEYRVSTVFDEAAKITPLQLLILLKKALLRDIDQIKVMMARRTKLNPLFRDVCYLFKQPAS